MGFGIIFDILSLDFVVGKDKFVCATAWKKIVTTIMSLNIFIFKIILWYFFTKLYGHIGPIIPKKKMPKRMQVQFSCVPLLYGLFKAYLHPPGLLESFSSVSSAMGEGRFISFSIEPLPLPPPPVDAPPTPLLRSIAWSLSRAAERMKRLGGGASRSCSLCRVGWASSSWVEPTVVGGGEEEVGGVGSMGTASGRGQFDIWYAVGILLPNLSPLLGN